MSLQYTQNRSFTLFDMFSKDAIDRISFYINVRAKQLKCLTVLLMMMMIIKILSLVAVAYVQNLKTFKCNNQ